MSVSFTHETCANRQRSTDGDDGKRDPQSRFGSASASVVCLLSLALRHLLGAGVWHEGHCWSKCTDIRVVHPVEAMMQCLSILLFKEYDVLLNHWEIENWAATETVPWNLVYQQKAEEVEIHLRHCEMVDEGWFSD